MMWDWHGDGGRPPDPRANGRVHQIYAGNQPFALVDERSDIYALGTVTGAGTFAVWLDPGTAVPRFERYDSLPDAERQLRAELARYGQFVATTGLWHGDTDQEYVKDELTLNKPQLGVTETNDEQRVRGASFPD